MDPTDSSISHTDWTPPAVPVESSRRVLIQSGRFAGTEAELVESLDDHRALVRLQHGVLLEIDTDVLVCRAQ